MDDLFNKSVCEADLKKASNYREELPGIIKKDSFAHIGDEPIHFPTSVKEMIVKFRN
jgi:serine O-acetyltransferase